MTAAGTGINKATLMAREFRHQEVRCFLDFSPRTLKSSMRLANKLDAEYLLIIGDDELQSGKYPLKRMSDGEQILVIEAEVLSRLRNVWGD